MKTCPECEYPNDDGEHRCEKCGIRFELEMVTAPPYSRAATAENPLDFPIASRTASRAASRASAQPLPAWRGEVHNRVRGFRERKGSQGSLPFESPQSAIESTTPSNVIRFPAPDESDTPPLPPALTAAAMPSATPALTPARTTATPHFPSALTAAPVGSVAQALTATAAPVEPTPQAATPMAATVAAPVATWGPPAPRPAAQRTSHLPTAEQQAIAFPRPNAEPQSMLEFPVASLKLRAISGAVDAAIIAAGCALFAAACYFCGGRSLMTWPLALPPRVLLIPVAAVAAILPVLYLGLFLTYTAATPGMRWTHLRLVDFDGRPATRRQRRRRVMASVSSMASILLGYLWAAVDDEHLTWHDRMSETCLTSICQPRRS